MKNTETLGNLNVPFHVLYSTCFVFWQLLRLILLNRVSNGGCFFGLNLYLRESKMSVIETREGKLS